MKWIFIYGPGRTGSTYMLRLIREVSRCSVSDWGLGSILKPLDSVVGIDKDLFLQDLAKNLIKSSKRNQDGQIDLVLKSAAGNMEEFFCYKKMFGEPERIIFTIREPSGYMASATKKFPDHEIQGLQDVYLKLIGLHATIGGRIFNYREGLTKESYLRFLEPLRFDEKSMEEFTFKGNSADHLVTSEMSSRFEEFLLSNKELLFQS